MPDTDTRHDLVTPPDSEEELFRLGDGRTAPEGVTNVPPDGAEGVALADVFVAGSAVADIDQLADNDMLAAVTAVNPDIIANLEHTFDQLVSTTDLFDVPAIDFDGPSDA